MSFDEVITLTPDDASIIGDALVNAAAENLPTRVAIDDGGVKFSIARGTWSPPIGTQEVREPWSAHTFQVATSHHVPPKGTP